MKTRVMRNPIMVLVTMLLLASLALFIRPAMSNPCGSLPNGLELNMPLGDAFKAMKSFGPPAIIKSGVYEWNVDSASKLIMTAKDGKLKSFENRLTTKNIPKSFNMLYRTWQLRVIEAYNNGYRIEFQGTMFVCYTCDGLHLYVIEVASDDGNLVFKRRWSIN